MDAGPDQSGGSLGWTRHGVNPAAGSVALYGMPFWTQVELRRFEAERLHHEGMELEEEHGLHGCREGSGEARRNGRAVIVSDPG